MKIKAPNGQICPEKRKQRTVQLLHRDAGQNVAVAVGQRAAQEAALVEQARRHVVERHLLPAGPTQTHVQDQSSPLFYSLNCKTSETPTDLMKMFIKHKTF